MSKNWITLMTGSWRTGPYELVWNQEGDCAFDPAAVISVKAGTHLPSGCIIYFNSGGHIVVGEDLSTVISEIQSAL